MAMNRKVAIGIAVFIVIALIIAIAVPLALRASEDDEPAVPLSSPIGMNCYPEAEGNPSAINKAECEKRGCIYHTNPVSCNYGADSFRLDAVNTTVTPWGFKAVLKQRKNAPFGGDIPEWIFQFENRGDNVARFTFDTADGRRYHVPKAMNLPGTKSSSPKYEIKITNNTNFAFQIKRISTGTVIFDIGVGPGGLVLSDQFLQITTRLPSTNVYGLGEHVHDHFKHEMNKTWTSFARDQPPSWDAMANLYGVHPFYTCVEDSKGSSHGVLMLNSNAQEYSFTTLPSLTFRTIGGILDFYIFMGPSPEEVIQQYTGVIGRPVMPPYWSLGFQLCRYDYQNITYLKEAVDSTAAYDIPHDVQYVDIDHMDTQKIFTVDHARFPGLDEYFKELQAGGMRVIYILDPCMISNETNYHPYEEMKKYGNNIKWSPNATVPEDAKDTDGALLGYVWPQGKTVFPDFFKNTTKDVWKKLIVEYRNNLTFDGIWIDMNEPASFGTNEERPFNWPEDVKPYWSLKCPSNQLEDPPYRPKAAYLWDNKDRKGRLSDKTICMSTVQGNHDEYSHYDVHSLYGWSQSDVTLDAVRAATGERGIVIGRSTFPGSGQWVGHWLGDNVSQWKDMFSSIIGIMEFNLFGIPYIGADICGFFDNTTEELCLRWMQLGAFYTFSRNHNTKGPIPQGPGQLGDNVGFASRDIMRVRYQLLPYLYTLFYESHTKGSTVIRPLHHEFPTDTTALNIERQFLWGSCLLISPILEKGQTVLNYYLPDGIWYDYFSHAGEDILNGANKSVAVNLTSKPLLHLRGGCVIVQQDYANNTQYSRQKPLTIVAGLDRAGKASGTFFWDNGVAIDSIEKKDFYHANIRLENYALTLTVSYKTPEPNAWDGLVFRKVILMGLSISLTNVTHVGKPLYFKQTGQYVEVDLPDIPMRNEFTIVLLEGMDCFPEAEGNSYAIVKEQCEKRGCTYYSNPAACRYNTANYSLQAMNVKNTTLGVEAMLKQNGNAPFGGDIRNWTFNFEMRGNDIARFTFDTTDGKRYKVPKTMNLQNSPGTSPKYEFKITDSSNFAFQILRSSTKTVIFDIGVGPGGLVLSDQFLQITTRLPSTNVYGLGEHVHDHFKHEMNKTWTSFARDQPPSWDSMANLYGVHPFYTCVEDSEGNTHGILMLNSNAQEYSFTSLPSLTFRTIGGILDFYVFLGPSPEEVIQQYTGAIGRPVMPPYWALGFQLCRYDYQNITNLKKAVETTAAYEIPHDVQYVDIDHMDTQKIFTVDHARFPGLNEYFKELQAGGMRIIYILDPCMIANETGYHPYEEMKRNECNIKWDPNVTPTDGANDTDGALLGYVWPQGKTVFPDYMKNVTKTVWKKLIMDYRSNLTFDGIWIDMNEPASFGTNEERPFNWPENVRPYWSLQCPKNNREDPPYRTKAAYRWDKDDKKGRLSDKTICMSTVQGNNNEYSHYDVHSLYGWSQSDVTLDAVRAATGERGIVIGRSTFPGSGQWVGHWLGDNVSQWKDMFSSIIGLLEFNLFGIPYIGADICGFFDNTTEELCLRWMQLGAFYTFSRNHNTKGPRDQGPGQLGDDVGFASRDIMRVRYQLLPYLYTLFHEAHSKGSTVIRPLHHEYPTDQVALTIEKQFLWGSCLLISPILEEGQSVLEYYLPKGKWYDYFTHDGDFMSQGRWKSINVDLKSKPMLHLRGGCIIVQQDYANNTHYSRQKPLKMVVTLDDDGMADGQFYWDDGVAIDAFEKGNYYMAEFKAKSRMLSLKVTHQTPLPNEWDSLTFTKVIIMGVNIPVVQVAYDGGELPFNQTEEVLEIALSPEISMRSDFTLVWVEGQDCFPEAEGIANAINKTKCEERGCIYLSNPIVCQYSRENYSLQASSITNTSLGLQATLTQNGKAPFGGDVKEWIFTYESRGNDIARFTFDTADRRRYKVPKDINLPTTKGTAPKYELKITSQQNFAFQIIRSSTKTVIFDIGVGPGGLVLSDQFLQITTRLPSTNVYGLGEHVHDHFKHEMNKTWTSFARDQPPSWDAMANLYGVHPFYTCVEDTDGNTHGIFMLNSNAQEYSFTNLPSLTFRTIGGILDFYVFMGSSPEEVIQQYTGAIGRPVMPAYWALGFHLCRYDYNNITNLQEAVKSTARYEIPHDVQYVDIDHMDTQKIFTVDHARFPGLNEYFKELQAGGMRIIYILDPCMIANETGYHPYEEMKRNECNIKWDPNVTPTDGANDTDGALLGYVWPQGKTVFPDYMKNVTKTVWKKLIVDYRSNLTFDGIWIDMNEPASFGTNEERPFNWPEDVRPYWSLQCPKNNHEDPPYRPKAAYLWDNANKQGRLSDKTICMSTMQGDNNEYSHYDVHSLYGWSQSDVTLDAVRAATGERGIVIGRSTFPGSGQWVGHWLGDNVSQWKDMFSSIIGILEFNLFGIPYIGADICGFFENTTEELCLRWMQLGAFYTFSRNHNTKGPMPQGPGQLGDAVGNASREIMQVRYQLLPYLYTLFYEAHTKGSTVIRPLHHEFPKDTVALNTETQFLWGACLLISPILKQGQTELKYYLPQGKWYDYFTHAGEEIRNGANKSVAVNLQSKPMLHLRGGCIIVQQGYANNTHYSRQKPLSIIAALDESNKAEGIFFWDNGVTIDSIGNGTYYLAKLTVEAQMLKLSVINKTVTVNDWDSLSFNQVHVLGVSQIVTNVTHDGSPLPFTLNNQTLTITVNKSLPMREDFTLTWTT
ncbi:unnamed protein product [Lymnaea stagnalis]|uniref:Maltase-glucoamylase, intestinal n=1 Tax=Lymnaea stagnalis TaxID=6523 RepID=A0AAV2HQM0_LYMST